MINIVEGDIRDAKEGVVAHQVNCQGAMASGVAKAIYTKWPQVKTKYLEFCADYTPQELLGRTQYVKCDDKYVANVFGQLYYGKNPRIIYTDYDALRFALTHVGMFAKKHDLSIALPYRIGCGLANGDWDIVHRIMQIVFEGKEVTLYKL